MTAREEDSKTIREVLLNEFVKDGKSLTVKQLAVLTGWSETRVRRALTSDSGFSDGLKVRKESRTSYSRDYPMFESGAHTVNVYLPDLEALRKEIIKLRSKS